MKQSETKSLNLGLKKLGIFYSDTTECEKTDLWRVIK